MSKSSISSLAEAIAKLESISNEKADHLKQHIENDYEQIKSALESVRPYFDDIKEKAEQEAKEVKSQVEAKVKDNPWMAIGIVGIVAFFIGLFLGRDRK